MKKLLIIALITFIQACYSHSPAEVNVNKPQVNVVKPDISPEGSLMSFSFSLKDSGAISRIKSVDAYLVKNYESPLIEGANVYQDGFKYQADVVNGNINIIFSNYPVGGPYYLALQAFDNIVESYERKNITLTDLTIISGDKQVARSSNNVSYNHGKLVYSDGSNSLNVSIKLSDFNNPIVNLIPVSGSETPTNGISVR